jgi:ribosomal protein S18 acetylase RimI-like enzyme
MTRVLEQGMAPAVKHMTRNARGEPTATLTCLDMPAVPCWSPGIALQAMSDQHRLHTLCGHSLPCRPQAYADLASRHGPFYTLDFVATHPKATGRGLASALIDQLKSRADSQGRAMFLVATSAKLR